MAEIGGQHGQSSLGILTGPVPLHESVCRKTMTQMPHVVQARATTVGSSSQTNLSRHRVESSMNVCAIQTIAPAGNEQIGGQRSSGPMAPASGDVVGKYLAGRGMQGHQASLAELGA